MCIEDNQVFEQSAGIECNKRSKVTSYIIKKVIRALFGKHRDVTALKASTFLESLDNMRNIQVEEEHYEEIEENVANEKLLACIYDEVHCHPKTFEWKVNSSSGEEDEVYVPVRFARTDAGTFFWTTNLQPVDVDLAQPTHCSSTCQHPELQFQDRWAQA